jgi:hypothetical protein
MINFTTEGDITDQSQKMFENQIEENKHLIKSMTKNNDHDKELSLKTAASWATIHATFWIANLSTPRSHRHWFCIVSMLRSRSFTQAGPWNRAWIIATKPARHALPRRDLGF